MGADNRMQVFRCYGGFCAESDWTAVGGPGGWCNRGRGVGERGWFTCFGGRDGELGGLRRPRFMIL
jgi:hypothetical protein